MLPKLFEFGPLTLHTYGLLLVTAYLLAISLTARLAERDGIPRAYAWDLGFVVILSALLGAKFLMVLSEFDLYWREPSLLFSLQFWRAGGVFYGGLLGAVAGGVIYAWRRPEVTFWRLADAAAPAIPLGQSIGRLGCLAAGCDYGKPTDVPWAITFTNPYAHEHVGVPLNIPLHPTQIYESFATFIIFLALLALHRRRAFVGQVFLLYFLMYGVARFFLEYFRGDEDRGFVLGWFSTSQFISLLIVPVALLLYWHLASARRHGKQA
jgi:phosphatidylglycerol---prolipoprotein diacylglyceryl transferase